MLRDLTNGRVGRDGEEVTVDQLQRSTDEISGSLSEPTRMFLAEVYTVRRQELRYLQKEIGMQHLLTSSASPLIPRRRRRRADFRHSARSRTQTASEKSKSRTSHEA